MVSTDSCLALPMKEQVFTTMTSASSARGVSSAPARCSRPIMTSLSTRFLGQPRLTKPILVGLRGLDCSPDGATIGSFNGMESIYFSRQVGKTLRANRAIEGQLGGQARKCQVRGDGSFPILNSWPEWNCGFYAQGRQTREVFSWCSTMREAGVAQVATSLCARFMATSTQTAREVSKLVVACLDGRR